MSMTLSMNTKIPEEIKEINAERARALRLLEMAAQIFSATGCSLGSDTVGMCLHQLREDGCDEY